MKKIPVLPSSQKTQLIVILLVYAFFAFVFGYEYRYAINPDGVSLLRLAGYLAEGNFWQSVTHSWSPLTIWVISAFLYFGCDGLTAARIALALSGAGFLLSCWLLAGRFGFSKNIRFIAVLIASLLISNWSIFNIGADILVAALTVLYISLLLHPDVLSMRRFPFFGGITAGCAYLAHHYFFPFFFVHFPSMLFLSAYFSKENERFPWKNVFISWVIGIMGFLIIASQWIGIVSVKYGQLTISSKGSIAHAVMGPADKDRHYPFFIGGLYKPKNLSASHVYEDPSEIQFKTWSPFESREYFIHQLKLIKNNTIYIMNHFIMQSPFFTYAFVIGILSFIPLALLLNPLSQKKKHLYAWVIITFCIYSSGFLLVVAKSPRRFYALMIIFLFLCFHFFGELIAGIDDIIPDWKRKIFMSYLFIILVAAFTLKPGVHFLYSLKNIITVEQVNPYEEIAGQINTVEFPSPYAIIRSSQKHTTDYYLNYFLNKQLLGRPISSDIEGLTEELKAAGAKSLVVFDQPEILDKLKNDKRYVHKASIKLKDNERYEQAVNTVIKYFEIVTGWDKEVHIFIVTL
jgi:hypothetical protein